MDTGFKKSVSCKIRKGLKNTNKVIVALLSKYKNDFPFLGFHKFLVVQTIKNLFRSPLNPLPMFKK